MESLLIVFFTMGSTAEEIKKNYEQNLIPEDYYEELIEEIYHHSEAECVASLTALYKLVKSGKFKGDNLLDLGSGPTVHNIASASAFYTNIVLSDFVLANRRELKKWLQGESKLDWSPFLNLVSAIEGYKNINFGTTEIEKRIRRNVTSVIHCDVLSDQVLPPEVTVEYDLIITSQTICAAAPDYETYKLILQRINRLLKRGGGLVLIGYFKDGFWGINGNTFHTLSLNQEQIEKALDFAGFTDKEWSVFPRSPTAVYKYDKMFNVVATKL